MDGLGRHSRFKPSQVSAARYSQRMPPLNDVPDDIRAFEVIGVIHTHDTGTARISPHYSISIIGDPYGNRTRVSAVKGPRPNR